MHYAHSTTDFTRADWQVLPDHLESVAAAAARYGGPMGMARAARLAGLLHDLGKYDPDFQGYISGQGASVDHSTAGAAMVRQLAMAPSDRLMAELIGYAIAGHHAGLPDKRGEGAGALSARLERFCEARLDPCWRDEINPDATELLPAYVLGWATDRERLKFRFALLGRMLFSCLVDADFKDTEAFYARNGNTTPDREWPELQAMLPRLTERYEAHMAERSSTSTPVNRLRGEILHQVRAGAAMPPGLFTLTVPTGGGKTLASLGFALDHARHHGHRRIVYAIPFTAIIDQCAAIFRDVLGPDVVLEHHSAIEDEREPSERREGRSKLRLAMEDWAAPIVVTTNVQLFESLFASRPARCRKLHNLAGSIIVLDEAQTLPRPLLLPILEAIDALANDYGVTIVLCTATQPALDRRHLKGGLALEGRELAPEPERLVRELRRVTLRQGGELTDDALVAELAATPQALVVVNSRKHALALCKAAQAAGLDGVIHLSTRMCAAHRRPLFGTIKARLKAGQPCRVISTSLIEAGVDVDFPRVWRAEAGLDQIAQAAGRCNREGMRPVPESVVTVFEAPDNPPPSELRQLSDARKRMQHKFADLFAPEAMTEYFREVYWALGPERLDRGRVDRKSILSKFAIEGGTTEFAYRSAAENFRMIESGMLPVIVSFDERAQRAIELLGVEAISSGRLARELQTYIVQVPPQARQKLIAAGRARVEAPHLRADQFVVLNDHTLYHEDIGLVWEDAEYLGIEALVQV